MIAAFYGAATRPLQWAHAAPVGCGKPLPGDGKWRGSDAEEQDGMRTSWDGVRVTVMGLGRFGGGVGVTQWLVRHGARVTVTDTATADALAASVKQLDGVPVTLKLGGHDERDFTDTDVVVANPAVPHTSPYLAAAQAAGVPLTTEINLFVERCPATCIAITGSVGKSTITAMTGHVLERAQDRRAWVGGNIGRSLLDVLPEMTAAQLVVLELSSFQLHYTPRVRWSPRVAVLTNITPNHLDWHGTFAAYLADKLNLVRFQNPARDAIIIDDQPDLRRHFELMFGDLAGVWRYGLDGSDLAAVMQTTSAVECDDRRLRWPNVTLQVPGQHNRRNAAAALTVAAALGVDTERAVTALATFAGLPHRLRRVATVDGVAYYDDSKSTTAEAVITALAAMEGPALVILGGYDKHVDLTPAVEAVAAKARFAACIGQTGPQLCAALKTRGAAAELYETLEAAVTACRERAKTGDSVLLSPGCASWGMFEDYRARGAAFTRCVEQIAAQGG
jgi:UDP-N-acetylmuramoylalanine--D-glutamate ligase